jgi:hypothetical protein
MHPLVAQAPRLPQLHTVFITRPPDHHPRQLLGAGSLASDPYSVACVGFEPILGWARNSVQMGQKLCPDGFLEIC